MAIEIQAAEDPSSFAEVFDGTSWSSLTRIDADLVIDVSCATTTLCAAVDDLGRATVFNGSVWSKPVAVDRGGVLNAVSCPSAGFCMAVGGSNATRYAYIYDGTGWRPAPGAGTKHTMYDVSCVSTLWCMAIDGQHSAIYRDGAWTEPVLIWKGVPFVRSVSCTSETTCLAVSGGSKYLLFDGTGWTPPAPMKSGGEATTDCISSTLCIAIAYNFSQQIKAGNVSSNRFDGTTWSKAELIEKSRGGFADISCPTASFCAAVDSFGFTLTRTHGHWSEGTQVDLHAGFRHVSCASSIYCVAVDRNGNATTFDGSTWTKPAMADDVGFASLSCPTTTFCLGADTNAKVTMFDGTSWTTPTEAEPGFYVRSVSCTSASYCVAVAWSNDELFALTYDGSTWSQPVDLGWDGGGGVVSCGSTTLCVVAGDGNIASTFDGTTWSGPQRVRSQWATDSVSCGTICVVFGSSGGVTYSERGWTRGVSIDPLGALDAVSCTFTRNCVAVDFDGWAMTRSTAPGR